jgi:hypothetical protein
MRTTVGADGGSFWKRSTDKSVCTVVSQIRDCRVAADLVDR